MTEAWVLIDAVPGQEHRVLQFLDNLSHVHDRRLVHYGHFDFLVKVDGSNHAAVQGFIISKLRFAPGVENVREIEDNEVPSVLATAAGA